MSRIHFSTIPLAVCALVVCGTLQAASLVVPATVNLPCDTVLGPSAVSINVLLAAGASSGTVTPSVSVGTAAFVVLPSPATVSSTTVPTVFTFSAAAGCKNMAATQTVTLSFLLAGGTASTSVATIAVTSAASALAVSPSAVTLTCIKNGNAGSAQTVNVTSPSYLGTPFVVNNSATAVNGAPETVLPTWLTVSAGGTASATPIVLTLTPQGTSGSLCASLPVGNTTYNVHLTNPPAPDKILPVTVQVGVASTLTSSPTSISLSYTKGSFTYNSASATLSASPAVFFSIDPTTMPLWLNATTTSGSTSSPVTVPFVPTVGAETLALGTYTANVHFKVSGDLDTIVPVTLTVKNPAATLSVAEGVTRSLNWVLGQALPTMVITPVSSDSPIAYTVSTTAGTLSPQVAATTGVAYSFGSAPIPVTFLQAVFGGAVPGATLTGTVTFTPTSGSAVAVAITVHVLSPGATISGISPTAIPTATSGTFTVVLSGSGFVTTGVNLVTKAGIVSNGIIVSDFFVTPTVIDSTTIALAIVVPTAADPYLPFTAGGSVLFGVCNPAGTNCSTPASTYSLTIGINPIVTAVTSASSYMQAAAPALNPVSAFDILSVFGSNFCVTGGTGCISPSPTVLYGSTDPVTSRYLTTLSPDSGATPRNLSVTFQTHAATPVAIGSAPLLFATNNQINLVVPSAVSAYIGSTVDIVVNFGTTATSYHSLPYSVTIVATDPGVFTVGGDGQGDAAALLPNYSLITSSNPAGARTGTDSDIISLYVTGLGVPDSVTGTAYYTAFTSVSCMAVADYWAAVNAVTTPTVALTSADGLVMQSAGYTGSNIQPCLNSAGNDVPTATVGGITAPVTFAGWVSGSVAGLYQINVQIPVKSSLFVDAAGDAGAAVAGTAMQVPIVVTANSILSQPLGVDTWIIARLKLTVTGSPNGAHGSALTGLSVAASEGTSTYTYAVTTGTLPAGMTLNAGGTITGTPTTAGTTTVIVTGTDSASPALTGTVSITFVIS